MIALRKETVRIFVDRSSHQWIVLDLEGNYWAVPTATENPWDHRQPYLRTEESELEPVPGHYRYMLGLPA